MHFYSPENIQKLEAYLKVKSSPSNHEIQLLEKLMKYNEYFTKIPWVLGIALCNSLAMNSANEHSDIDLFVVTKSNRIWTVRIIMTLLLAIMWQRKTSKKHAGKFCLSFFISQDWLDLTNIALENDIYLAYWIDTLKPIINRNNIFEDFIKSNSFLLGTNKEIEQKIIEQSLLKTSPLLKKCGDYIEKCMKFIFLARTKNSFQKLWKPFWVVISDTMLKFHNNDKRKDIRDIIISS